MFCESQRGSRDSLLPWLHFRHSVAIEAVESVESEAFSKPRDVPRRRQLTLEIYQKEFEGRIPVVLEGAYDDMPCLEDGWIEKNIMKPFQDERVVFTGHKEKDERVMGTKLKTFLKNINQNSQSAWSYLKDEYFLARHPDLMVSCPPLPSFLRGQDQFALMPAQFIPPNATLLWGGRYSRSKLHVDSYNWTGTNVVIRGEKYFRLIPPGYDGKLDVVVKRCFMALECTSYESAKDLFNNEAVPQGVPLWETKLQKGDALIIPSGWWHQAVNLGTTLAMARSLRWDIKSDRWHHSSTCTLYTYIYIYVYIYVYIYLYIYYIIRLYITR